MIPKDIYYLENKINYYIENQDIPTATAYSTILANEVRGKCYEHTYKHIIEKPFRVVAGLNYEAATLIIAGKNIPELTSEEINSAYAYAHAALCMMRQGNYTDKKILQLHDLIEPAHEQLSEKYKELADNITK